MMRLSRVGFVLMAAGLTGCSTMNNTEKGTLIGAGAGSIVGTAIGAATGNPRTGAAVGALGGAALGGIAGNAEDKRDQQVERAAHQQQLADAQAAQAQLGIMDVMRLVQSGVDAGVICEQIRATGSTFQLSTADIEYLTSHNVPAAVIKTMQSARPRGAVRPRPIIVHEPAPVIIERPVYGQVIYGPPPPMVGFHYHHRRGGW